MKAATEPKWDRAVEPTPEQFVAWFLENDHAGRIEIAEWAIRFSREAMDCVIRHNTGRAAR